MNELRVKYDALSFMLLIFFPPPLPPDTIIMGLHWRTDRDVCQRLKPLESSAATLRMRPRDLLSGVVTAPGGRAGFLHVVKASHITLKVTLTGFRAAGGPANTQWQI